LIGGGTAAAFRAFVFSFALVAARTRGLAAALRGGVFLARAVVLTRVLVAIVQAL
jgi:hypothetical protein